MLEDSCQTQAMRLLLLFFLLCSMNPAWSQEKPDFELPTPSGWREDIMKLPPDFAPDMSWTGWEIAEFSPGMFKAAEPDFFSYVFVIQLEEVSPNWEDQLFLYFSGMARAVMKSPGLELSDFEVAMTGDEQSSYGTVRWIEPFATKKPQKLYLECRQIGPGLWYGCVSPKPWDWPIWTEMRRMRMDFEESQMVKP